MLSHHWFSVLTLHSTTCSPCIQLYTGLLFGWKCGSVVQRSALCSLIWAMFFAHPSLLCSSSISLALFITHAFVFRANPFDIYDASQYRIPRVYYDIHHVIYMHAANTTIYLKLHPYVLTLIQPFTEAYAVTQPLLITTNHYKLQSSHINDHFYLLM